MGGGGEQALVVFSTGGSGISRCDRSLLLQCYCSYSLSSSMAYRRGSVVAQIKRDK